LVALQRNLYEHPPFAYGQTSPTRSTQVKGVESLTFEMSPHFCLDQSAQWLFDKIVDNLIVLEVKLFT
jgi:hypothetical protein